MRAFRMGVVAMLGWIGIHACNVTVAPVSAPSKKLSKSPVASVSPLVSPSASPSPIKTASPIPRLSPTPSPTPTPGPPATDAEVNEVTAFPFTRVGQKWVYKLTFKLGNFDVDGVLTLDVLELTATGARVRVKTEVAYLAGKPQEAERVITRLGGNPYAQINAVLSGTQEVTSTTPENTKESVTVPFGTYPNAVRSKFSSVSGGTTADFNLWMVKDLGMVKESISSDKPPASLGTLLGSGMTLGKTTTLLELKDYSPGNASGTPVPNVSTGPSLAPVVSPSPVSSGNPSPSVMPSVGPSASASAVADATAFPFTQAGQKWEYVMGLKVGSNALSGTMKLEVLSATQTGAQLKIDTTASAALPIPLPPQSLTREVTRAGGDPYAQINAAITGDTTVTSSVPTYSQESVTVPAGTFNDAVRAKFSSTGSDMSADFDMWLVKDRGMVKETVNSNKPPSSLALLGALPTTTTLELKTYTPATQTALQRILLALNWPAFTVR